MQLIFTLEIRVEQIIHHKNKKLLQILNLFYIHKALKLVQILYLWHNLIDKTKALWRRLSPVNKKPNKKLTSVQSWSDLDKLKIKYRTEVLKSKSKQKLFQQNMKIIEKLQQISPKVDAWCQSKLKRTPRASSDQLLSKNLEIIKKIQETYPKVESWNFYKPKLSPRSKERRQSKFKLFQQNMKIIQRVQSVSPKIQTWNHNKPKINKKLLSQRRLYKQKLFQQNIKIIDKVQSASPKVESWADIKNMRKLVKKKMLQNTNKSCQTITKMQKIIEEAERKLVEKDIQLMHHRRIKTLPNLSPSSKLKIAEHKKNVNRLILKIEKSKPSVDCWIKQSQQDRILNKAINMKKIENKNYSILQMAKKVKQLQYMNKNMQISRNIRNQPK